MDRMTFESFQNYSITGARSQSQKMNLLTKEENHLFQYLKISEKQLEQEKIPQMYMDGCLKRGLKPKTDIRCRQEHSKC
ncbi:hypothetical protein [Pedobacter suwonensis]